MPPKHAQLRTKMAKSLIPAFTAGGENRLDLFRTWLEKSQDFSLVELEVSRKNTQKQKAKTKEKRMSKCELEQDPRYTPEDVKELIERKTRLGEYICDPNFPSREDLRQYIVNSETVQENQHVREDTQAVTSTTSLTPVEALTLTEEGAVFAAGAHPSIREFAHEAAPRDDDTRKTRKGGAKGGGKTKTKTKTKTNTQEGGEGGEGGEKPEGGDEKPDKPPTPLQKAITLKKAVFLV